MATRYGMGVLSACLVLAVAGCDWGAGGKKETKSSQSGSLVCAAASRPEDYSNRTLTLTGIALSTIEGMAIGDIGCAGAIDLIFGDIFVRDEKLKSRMIYCGIANVVLQGRLQRHCDVDIESRPCFHVDKILEMKLNCPPGGRMDVWE